MLNFHAFSIVYIYMALNSFLFMIALAQFVYFFMKRVIGIFLQDKAKFNEPLYWLYFGFKCRVAFEVEKELSILTWNKAVIDSFGVSGLVWKEK